VLKVDNTRHRDAMLLFCVNFSFAFLCAKEYSLPKSTTVEDRVFAHGQFGRVLIRSGVATKYIDASLKSAARMEFEKLSGLVHPNIQRIKFVEPASLSMIAFPLDLSHVAKPLNLKFFFSVFTRVLHGVRVSE
jgi:hypothetical protein